MGHDKWFGLEERLRVVEGNNLIHHVIAVEDCLVLNIMVSKEFRALDFVKYTRLECPYTHLRSFYNKMAKMIHNDKMLIYFFQDSLTGSVLSWYMRLDNIKINIWKDLVDVFLKQYKFNLETAPDRTILMVMEKENLGSVRAYAQRWRDKAACVQPPLLDIEMVMLFANTFQSSYYVH